MSAPVKHGGSDNADDPNFYAPPGVRRARRQSGPGESVQSEPVQSESLQLLLGSDTASALPLSAEAVDQQTDQTGLLGSCASTSAPTAPAEHVGAFDPGELPASSRS